MRIILLLPALLSLHVALAQFAPIGAQWTYDQPDTDGYTVTVMGDTVIDGITCSIVQGELYSVCWESRVFTYQDGDRVFFRNAALDDFTLLYDWGAADGESWQIVFPESFLGIVLTVTVNTTGTIVVDGQVRRFLQVEVHDDTQDLFPYSSGMMIEGIGDVLYLFPWHMPWCDAMFPGPLRCYTDDAISWSNPATNGCTTAIGLPEMSGGAAFTVSPTLLTAGAPIQVSDLPSGADIRVFDGLGKQVRQERAHQGPLTFALAHSGTYTLVATLPDGRRAHRRIVVL